MRFGGRRLGSIGFITQSLLRKHESGPAVGATVVWFGSVMTLGPLAVGPSQSHGASDATGDWMVTMARPSVC